MITSDRCVEMRCNSCRRQKSKYKTNTEQTQDKNYRFPQEPRKNKLTHELVLYRETNPVFCHSETVNGASVPFGDSQSHTDDHFGPLCLNAIQSSTSSCNLRRKFHKEGCCLEQSKPNRRRSRKYLLHLFSRICKFGRYRLRHKSICNFRHRQCIDRRPAYTSMKRFRKHDNRPHYPPSGMRYFRCTIAHSICNFRRRLRKPLIPGTPCT